MKENLAKTKIYFFRGWSYAQLPAIGITAAYTLEAKFGIPFLYSVFLGVAFCVAVGAIDYKHGIAPDENNLTWDLTPRARNLCNDIEEIKNAVCKPDKE